jgi:hypothetical protein
MYDDKTGKASSNVYQDLVKIKGNWNIHGKNTTPKENLINSKTGNFCVAESRKFLHGIDKQLLRVDTSNFP